MKMDSQRILNAAAAMLGVVGGAFSGADGKCKDLDQIERLVAIDVLQTLIEADCDLPE